MTLHADALATLTDWAPISLEQAAHRDRIMTHLLNHPDGMTRECHPDHVTAGVVVLSADRSRVLLNLHRKANRWLAFGGHCEPSDATLLGVARREGAEESAIPDLAFTPDPIDLDVHAVEFCDPRGTAHHLDVRYGAVAPAGVDHQASEESFDVRWWPLDALPGLDADMLRLIAAARTQLV